MVVWGNIFKENCDAAGDDDNDDLMERRWRTSIWLALTMIVIGKQNHFQGL